MWWGLVKSSLFLVIFCACTKKSPPLTVYLASSLVSLKDAIEQASNTVPLNLAFHSSSHAAQQIAAGAPCEAVVVADHTWQNYLLEKALVNDDALIVAYNALVLASSENKAFEGDLKALLSATNEPIIIADPAFVPLGAYSKEALSALLLFNDIEKRAIKAHSAQHAAMLLRQGVAKLAILYASDVDNKNIYGVLAVDSALHKPIVYTFLPCRGAQEKNVALLKAIFKSPSFKEALRRKGFSWGS